MVLPVKDLQLSLFGQLGIILHDCTYSVADSMTVWSLLQSFCQSMHAAVAPGTCPLYIYLTLSELGFTANFRPVRHSLQASCICTASTRRKYLIIH